MTERDVLLPALDAALAALENGASLERVLAAQPALAAELRPLLLAALAAGAGAPLARVPAPAQAASRAQFLAAAAERRPAAVPLAGRAARLRGWLSERRLAGSGLLARAVAVGAVVLAGLSVGGYGAVAASAQSLPGDALYGVKRTVENTELLLTADPQARARLAAEFDDRRVREAQTVAGEGRPVAVAFSGTLNSMNGPQGQQWLVSGIAVLVGPQVPVQGTPVVGGRVHIQGVVQTAGLVQAQQVTVLAQASGPLPVTVTPSVPVTLTSRPTATTTALPILTNTPVPATMAPSATPMPPASATLTNPPPASATLAPTGTDDQGGGPGPSASNTPAATQGSGDDHGGSASQTPAATEDHGGGPGPSASNTPQATQGGGPGPSPSNTPQPTDDGGDDHGGGGGGGGPSPSNTPKPTDDGGGGGNSGSGGGSGGGGGGPSPSNTPKPED